MSLCLDHGNKGMISVNMPYGIYNKLKHVDCHNDENSIYQMRGTFSKEW
jgi:hypothetical protein